MIAIPVLQLWDGSWGQGNPQRLTGFLIPWPTQLTVTGSAALIKVKGHFWLPVHISWCVHGSPPHIPQKYLLEWCPLKKLTLWLNSYILGPATQTTNMGIMPSAPYWKKKKELFVNHHVSLVMYAHQYHPVLPYSMFLKRWDLVHATILLPKLQCCVFSPLGVSDQALHKIQGRCETY